MSQLEQLDLANFLTITPSAFLYKSPLENEPTILIVKFVGLYHSGSLGSPDYQFISAIRDAALYHHLPDGFIMDFSELEYKWGDEFDNLLPNDKALYYWRHTPMCVVVGPKCREAIRTLTFGLKSDQQLTETIWAKETLEDAMSFIEHRAVERKCRD